MYYINLHCTKSSAPLFSSSKNRPSSNRVWLNWIKTKCGVRYVGAGPRQVTPNDIRIGTKCLIKFQKLDGRCSWGKILAAWCPAGPQLNIGYTLSATRKTVGLRTSWSKKKNVCFKVPDIFLPKVIRIKASCLALLEVAFQANHNGFG